MRGLTDFLADCAARHSHLCPRQVLGVRMGMYAGQLLELELPQKDKRLLTIVETDGCAADGVAVATNCWVGLRTLRVEDYGKVAATFVDTQTRRAIRIVPHPHARERATRLALNEGSAWDAMLDAYQHMPDEALLVAQAIELTISLEKILSRPGQRVHCVCCGEEVMNEREVVRQGQIFCRACVGSSYYSLVTVARASALMP